ncbi:MAG: GTPase [Flavobacteriaceae bacterium]|nr:GTPase [Flavobacteriaceae bacterium]
MKLIFVYNANSGFLDKIFDSAHKIVSPSTYDCNLCAITFGTFTEDELWKAFRENSETPLEFYHKDKFLERYKYKQLPVYNFPIIFSEKEMELKLFISSGELDALSSSEALIEEITRRLSLH